jgi:hypothetical protein
MPGRRMLLLVALLMGLTALAASVAPRQPRPDRERAPEPTRAPAVPREGRIVERTISVSASAEPKRVQARVGDIVRLEVSGPVLDAVVLEGFDRVEGIAPEAPARFNLLAEAAGTHRITLREADRHVGELRILERR